MTELSGGTNRSPQTWHIVPDPLTSEVGVKSSPKVSSLGNYSGIMGSQKPCSKALQKHTWEFLSGCFGRIHLYRWPRLKERKRGMGHNKGRVHDGKGTFKNMLVSWSIVNQDEFVRFRKSGASKSRSERLYRCKHWYRRFPSFCEIWDLKFRKCDNMAVFIK